MNKYIFCGAAVATITPMGSDGSVDLERFSDFVDELVGQKIDAIVVNGTTGEAATLSDEEQYNIICRIKDVINHRVPLIAGAGSNDTRHAARLALNARNAGADAVLCVTPYYNKANDEGLAEHFRYIAEKSQLPMILYNVPSRTGVNLRPEWYERIADVPNIVAVKEASGNLAQIARIRAYYGDRFAVYSGNDDTIVPTLSLGGKGVISVLANIVPKDVHDLCVAYYSGDTKRAERLQLHYMPLIETLFSDVNPIPLKEALKIMGRDTGVLRKPLSSMKPEAKIKMVEILESYHLK